MKTHGLTSKNSAKKPKNVRNCESSAEHLQHRGARGSHGDEWRPLSLEEVRKIHIQRVLEMSQGNRLRAAQILGIGRTRLYRYLKRDGYDTGKAKPGSAEA